MILLIMKSGIYFAHICRRKNKQVEKIMKQRLIIKTALSKNEGTLVTNLAIDVKIRSSTFFILFSVSIRSIFFTGKKLEILIR